MSQPQLRVGVFLPDYIPQSFRVYARNVGQHLPDHHMELVPFHDQPSLPKSVDLLWDVRSGGGNPPLEFLLGHQPLVMTVHGFAPLTLSGWDYFGTLKGMLTARYSARKKLARWARLKNEVSAIVAVSHYTRRELLNYVGYPAERVVVCPHGVDAVFQTSQIASPDQYFFHISNGEPRKNIRRILKAFRNIHSAHPELRLVLKVPSASVPPAQAGVHVITEFLDDAALAQHYQNALGFLFPSLYEGFGMPILEAMACGCPVITANVSACSEVAGDAAMTVDPHDVTALANAMERLLNPTMHQQFSQKGLKRVQGFTWAHSAAQHAQAFKLAVSS